MPRAYKSYSEAERLTILATAVAEQLSATEVQRRFGVKPVTYYSWRKKCRLKSTHGLRGQRDTVSLYATRSLADPLTASVPPVS